MVTSCLPPGSAFERQGRFLDIELREDDELAERTAANALFDTPEEKTFGR